MMSIHSNNVKILHLITSLRTGGAEHLLVDLLPRLKNLGDDVDLAVLDGTRTPFYCELESRSIRVIPFSVGGSVYNPLNIFRLLKIFPHYDVIHTHNTSAQFFAVVAHIFRKKCLVTTEHSTNNKRRYWRYLKPIDKWMYNQYGEVICISDAAEQNLKGYLGNTRTHISTIYNGIDFSKFAEAVPSEDIMCECLGKKLITMVASFRPPKDQMTLIKSLIYLPDEYEILFVGDGEYRKEVEENTSEAGLSSRVHFLGVRTDVPGILKASDVVVLSSHYEGLSLSSVEGMASGKPFIASDVDGLREVVKGHGILFPLGDEKTLAEEILKLANDESYRENIVDKCVARARQFDISIMAEEYHNLYHKLVN